ncbi:FAD-binding oxidoreductase [Mycobacterium sp. URHB0044]|jgi:glycine/D-amino acid oxidase-like deaminating enzyme|uniref:NAD(P)/FAD-dependent oxidoreductase n=1 Tax=Mycobacterium sp. URHB0044 TaxID=1380386 RepID=UPI000688F0B1|nr:FAD-binding oxidoreductase [Mycobacterium sp. URHB0044]
MNSKTDSVPLNGAVYWLDEALAIEDQPACPPLVGEVTADVCIVGGGYLGLWTAIEILEQAPDTRVVLIEADGCGFGASGRNGGQTTGWHDELDVLIRLYGVEEGLRLAQRSSWAIDRVVDFCDQYEIDAHIRRHGMTKAAVNKYQIGKWRNAVQACDDHGRGDLLVEVDGLELRRRTGSPLPLSGATQTDGATLQPALLARGLRRVALQLGAKIYEGTPMAGLSRSQPAQVRTTAGCVTADQVVLAIGAWMGQVRELRRAFVPIGSSIVVTEPLGKRLLDRPFANGSGFGDQRLSVHHMQVTPDGRLIFGRGGGPLGPAGKITPSVLYDPRSMRSIAKDLRRWFPDLADAKITHAWSGAVDRAPSHLPFLGHLGDHSNIHYASGISGNGVAPTAYLGRVLGRMVLNMEDADTRSPLTHGPTEYLPPEPFRSVGGAVVRAMVERIENLQEMGLRLNVNKPMKKLISTTTPRLLEPRLWGRGDANR